MKRLLGIALAAVLAASLSACAQGKESESKESESSAHPTVSAPAAPAGSVNSADGMFQVKIPDPYLDAFASSNGQNLPDAQVILAPPAAYAIEGIVPAIVIDNARVVTDADAVESTAKEDPQFKSMRNFKQLESPPAGHANVLYVTWEYTRDDVALQMFMCFISGNNLAYAIKQEIPVSGLSNFSPAIEDIVRSWTWLPGAEDN